MSTAFFKRKYIWTLAGVSFLSLIAGLIIAANLNWTHPLSAKTEPPLVGGVPSFADLAQRVSPAVVNISTVKRVKGGGRVFDFFMGPRGRERQGPMDDFFERFFGDTPQREFKQKSLGSGILIDGGGYILTNNHVVEDADEIKVISSENKEYDAKVIGRDPKTDLALIQIKSWKGFSTIKLGDSDELRVGDWVVAIGNPFGLDHTVTAGIVSAKGRVIGAGPYDNFIQTDASINPGNSGGPLINLKGEVVGINTAIFAGGQGIGFAIPINTAKELIGQLKDKGKVTRGWLGVNVQKVTPDLAKAFNLQAETGALVGDVISGSPAEKAGIKPGDIIMEFNGKAVKEMSELPRLVAAVPVGKDVDVKLLRNGETLVVKARIQELQDKNLAAVGSTPSKEGLGLSVKEFTLELARRYSLSYEPGILVLQVKEGGPADEAGIQPGDIIKEVDRKPVKDLKTYQTLIDGHKKENPLLLRLKRKDSNLFVSIRIGE
ncbi:MAG: DegQ family serine endoprotease [Deltaproteobacteria bacterium]|nr:DegQ family serine endoprotease [Deltaproteobacteria bacterium]